MTTGGGPDHPGKRRSKHKRRTSRRKKEERKLRSKARELLGFQKNYPFSNKFFGNAYPKTVPETMYFNPISQDVGGIPKLSIDEKSKYCIANYRKEIKRL